MKGERDSRGPQGILARGNNVYNNGSFAAHSGGANPNLGRPRTLGKPRDPVMNPEQDLMEAIKRRLQMKKLAK